MMLWAPVLDRIDAYLERACQPPQSDGGVEVLFTSLPEEFKEGVMCVLRFTLRLFDHCWNRAVYNSVDVRGSCLSRSVVVFSA